MLVPFHLGTTLASVFNTKVISTLLASLANAANQLLVTSIPKLANKPETPTDWKTITTPTSPIIITGSTKSIVAPEAEVVTYTFNYDGHNLTGEVINKTGKTIKSLRLNYTYELSYQQLKVVYGGTIFVNQIKLLNSQTSTCQGTTQPNGANLKIQSAEWVDN